MIASTSFSVVDGTGWLVFEVVRPLTGVLPYYRHLDRPCDDCGGDPIRTLNDDVCPAKCIDGRHTFDIEVETGIWISVLQQFKVIRRRVSIVPGMVLPIARDLDHSRDMIVDKVAHIWISERGQAMWWTPDPSDEDPIWNYITLPPAAKPGKHWAVKLKVGK